MKLSPIPRPIRRRLTYIVLTLAAQREEMAERSAEHLLRECRGRPYHGAVTALLDRAGLDLPMEVRP